MSHTAVWRDSKQHVLPELAPGQHAGVQEWVTDSLQTHLLLLREATIQHGISKASLDFWNFKNIDLLLCSSSVALGVKVMIGQSSSKIQTELQSNSSKTVRTVLFFPFANQKLKRSQCRMATLMVAHQFHSSSQLLSPSPVRYWMSLSKSVQMLVLPFIPPPLTPHLRWHETVLIRKELNQRDSSWQSSLDFVNRASERGNGCI